MLPKSQFFMVATFIISLFCSFALAQVPQVINYQGMLTDAGGTALSGSFSIEFKIYDAPTAGNVLWTEIQTVTVTAGLFDVLLGSVTAIPYAVFDGNDKHLSLKVGNDPEMTPRKRLVSVGYALRAYNADKVDGKDASAFVEAGQANAITTPMIQDNAVTAAKIAPNLVSSLDGVSNDGGNIDLVAGANVTITPDDANNTITIAATGTGGIGGSGTADYLSKFTSTSTIGNSIILEKNNGLAIGTATMDANCVLTIEGTQSRPNGLLAIGHFGSTAARPAGIYAGLKSTSNALTGAGIYAKVLATENPNISYLYGAQFGAVADANTFCRGVTIGLEGNQVGSDDFALELLAVDPGYALYCRDNGKAYFGGNVGIGITNPRQKLEVSGTVQMTGFKLPTGAANNYVLTSDANGVGTWKTVTGTPDNDWTISSNNIYSAVSGNVGIGTANPVHKLHVVAQDNVGMFESTGNNVYLRLATNEGINNRVEIVNRSGGRLGLWTAGAGDVLNITRDGKVGIGTTTPGTKFHVVSEYLQFEGTTASAPNCPEIQIRETNSNAFWAMIKRGSSWSPEQNQLLFTFYNGSTWFSTMNLKTNKDVIFHGNVGIGTTNPTHKLHVFAQDAVGLFESTSNLAFLRLATNEGINNRVELKNNPGGMLSLWTAGTEAGDVLNITRNGNVGIGTMTPDAKLVVAGTAKINVPWGDDAEILWLNCERPFAFRQRGTGSGAGLDLRPNVDAKLISISASDKKILGGFFDEGGTTPDKVYFVPDGGYVGIGLSSPSRIFEIKQGAGSAIADGWGVYSSRRWKANIQPIQGALDKVKRLTGVFFDWKDSGKHDLGLIAEDVGQVIPEIVSYEENGIDAQTVDYARLVAILIQGMKEQQMTIEQLTKRVDELENKKR